MTLAVSAEAVRTSLGMLRNNSRLTAGGEDVPEGDLVLRVHLGVKSLVFVFAVIIQVIVVYAHVMITILE